jgi:hypothetical protein
MGYWKKKCRRCGVKLVSRSRYLMFISVLRHRLICRP